MIVSTDPSTARVRHAGPSPGFVAIAYSLVFLAGLSLISPFGGKPGFPNPGDPLSALLAFFQSRGPSVRLSGALQFGAAIPLGIFTATMASRLRFLGVRAAGAYIALFGGFAAALNLFAAGSVVWVMGSSAVTQSPAILQALCNLAFALGGPGFSAPFGLLMAGTSVTAGFGRLLPRWIVVLGLALAVAGELSWLALVLPMVMFLVPLTRFLGFIWLIAAGADGLALTAFLVRLEHVVAAMVWIGLIVFVNFVLLMVLGSADEVQR